MSSSRQSAPSTSGVLEARSDVTAHAEGLRRRIESRTATVGVIGLGYVGLPMTLTMAEKGFSVLGFDIDPTKIEALNHGRNYIQHLDGSRLSAALESGKFRATADFLRLREPDVLLICVPTPLTPQREPDMSFVVETAKQVKASLRPGQLVILESTTYPGTTDELVRGILEQTGLKCGDEFFLAFSPEREDPGNKSFGTATIPKVVGGVDPVSGDLAQALYDRVIARTVRVSSSRAAEATKLVENIFRAVNIALVNELKMVFRPDGNRHLGGPGCGVDEAIRFHAL
jgi:UDP-N-acetyl-D-glucosamine dehydrogenase